MKVSDEVVFLEEAFDVLNQRFFESALSRPAITIQSTPGAHGHFTPYDAWDDSGLKLKEINLGAESLHNDTNRPIEEIEKLVADGDHWFTAEEAVAFGICDAIVDRV